MASADRFFAEISTRRGERLRIAISEFKGQHFIAVRLWFEDNTGEIKPTSKGINVRIEHLATIAEGIANALVAARADCLLQEPPT